MPIVHDPNTGKFTSSGSMVMGKSAARATKTAAFSMTPTRAHAQVFKTPEAAGVAAKRFKGEVVVLPRGSVVKFGTTGYLK